MSTMLGKDIEERGLPRGLDQLNAATNELINTVELVENRLAFIARSEPTNSSNVNAVNPRPPQSQAVDQLAAAIESVQRATERLHALLGRLDI